MENFNNSFSEIIFEIVYSVLDYCDNSVEKIFIHCANEENCISSNIFFQKNGKKIKGSQLNCISEHSQKEIIHIVNEKIKDLRNLCLNNNKEVPTEIKLIYETANKQLISDFYYEKLFSNSENVLIQDIFDNWFIS